jgi:hypothetical protein
MGDEPADLLDRHHLAERALDARQIGYRADVDRQQIVGNRRPSGTEHPAPREIKSAGAGMIKSDAGEAGQRAEVDVDVVEAVMAGDVARQHARIGRDDVARDQGQPDSRQRPHGKAPQHLDMAVSAADQHQVLDHEFLGAQERSPAVAMATPGT